MQPPFRRTVTNTVKRKPHAPAALMTLIKAGVIQEIAKSDSPMSAEDLSRASGADKLLIGTTGPMSLLLFKLIQDQYASCGHSMR